MSRLSLYLLGPPRIERDGVPVQVRRRKAIALLAYLAVTGRVHSRDSLATLLWPEQSQSRARAGLRTALADLRKALGEGWLEADRETAGLAWDEDASTPSAGQAPSIPSAGQALWLDVRAFQDLLADCRAHGHAPSEACPACLGSLAEAADLYRDDFLAGFTLPDSPAFDDWQFFQSQGLHDELASVLEQLALAHGERGDHEQAIAYARRWVALDPLHEPAQRCLIRLYAWSGQRAAALRQYEACAQVLQAELGVPPGEETTALCQAIKEGREPAAVEPRAGRYRFEHLISDRGSFGDVWLATDTVLERDVAIKCPKATGDAVRRERFLTEARLLARLNHPNITQIYDVVEEQDRFYLVIEYVDGRDLREILAGGALSLDLVLEVAKGILEALAYAHGRGIVHRDVKPSNVLIGEEVKLTDLNLAGLRSILERGTSRFAGTPAYMAPEQIEGRPMDGRADLYAVGVVLYQMIAGGRRPFESPTESEMLDAHLHAEPPPLSQYAPTVPPALEQVVMRLLAKDPEDRYPSAKAVIEALDAIHVGTQVSNLPVQLTPFVGRERELASIGAKLGDPDCRLLTLTGPGGVGKTRLAAEASLAHADAFAHGVCFVPLAPLQSVDAILLSVAQALSLDFRFSGDPQQQVLDHLSGKSMLLVLDNLEHLLDGARRDAADVVSEVLRAGTGVKVLATSRARLGVHGEHLILVPGMDYPALARPALPDGDAFPSPTCGRGKDTLAHSPSPFSGRGEKHSAVRLFVNSARRVHPGFALTDDAATHVAAICQLVEGLPLAIEMAAGWVGLLSPEEIAAEIQRSLDILQTDLRGVPADGIAGGERHRSIRAVFDHSWDLLAEREREVFQGLSVFRGSFSREAAQEVTGASLGELMALASKSLLARASGGRYQVHELLRRYGAEKLDASPDAGKTVRERHSAHYADVMESWDVEWPDPCWTVARTEMDVERENARAAWDWAVTLGNLDRLGRSLQGLCHCYNYPRKRLQEGEAACRAAAERLWAMVSDEAPADVSSAARWVLARTLAFQAGYSENLGRVDEARRLHEQSLAVVRGITPAGRDVSTATIPVPLEAGLLLDRARGSGQPVAFMISDIDDFRHVNNTYGHHTGDLVLAELWRLCEQGVKGRGILRRWGGEEFALLLPDADGPQAFVFADQIRRDVQDHVFRSDDGRDVRVTISIGIAVYPRDAQDLFSLHELADHAAHLAKRMGKNKVLLAGELEEGVG
jgi:diguanylate cyclase (GGDEF)-like protein